LPQNLYIISSDLYALNTSNTELLLILFCISNPNYCDTNNSVWEFFVINCDTVFRHMICCLTDRSIIIYCRLRRYLHRPRILLLCCRTVILGSTMFKWTFLAHVFSTILHSHEQLVEGLCYKPEGRGFKSRWGHWIFFQLT
jgi:hypothetical protein